MIARQEYLPYLRVCENKFITWSPMLTKKTFPIYMIFLETIALFKEWLKNC